MGYNVKGFDYPWPYRAQCPSEDCLQRMEGVGSMLDIGVKGFVVNRVTRVLKVTGQPCRIASGQGKGNQ